MKVRTLLALSLTVCCGLACGDDSQTNNGTTTNNQTNQETKTNNATNNDVATNNDATSNNDTNSSTNNGTPPDTFDPGVSPDTALNELDEQQRAAACEAMVAFYAESGVHAARCKLEGYTAAENTRSVDETVLREACQERVDTCLDELREGPGSGHLCFELNCTATVEQAVECAVELGEAEVDEIGNLPDCDEITADDLDLPETIEFPTSPACAAVNDTCN